MDLFNQNSTTVSSEDALVYKILLTLIKGIGNVTARNLIAYCGSISNIFQLPKKQLLAIPGIGPTMLERIRNYRSLLPQAYEEIAFINDQQLQPLFYFDKAYPVRLKNCVDAPLLLYYKGNVALNQPYVISVVGTRNATSNGLAVCRELIKSLSKYNPLIISGLAYGIDYEIHKACVQNEVATIGVLAHGLDRIYPPEHDRLANQMLQKGGWLTEYRKGTQPNREHFPTRNRIVAGMTDATIVVETGKKGGSMITAFLADSYNREVFAYPGRINDRMSTGCNELIKKNIAALVESGEDIAYNLGWDLAEKNKQAIAEKKLQERTFYKNLPKNEQTLLQLLTKDKGKHIDTISLAAQMSSSELAAILLSLEFKNLITPLPGKYYKLA